MVKNSKKEEEKLEEEKQFSINILDNEGHFKKNQQEQPNKGICNKLPITPSPLPPLYINMISREPQEQWKKKNSEVAQSVKLLADKLSNAEVLYSINLNEKNVFKAESDGSELGFRHVNKLFNYVSTSIRNTSANEDLFIRVNEKTKTISKNCFCLKKEYWLMQRVFPDTFNGDTFFFWIEKNSLLATNPKLIIQS